MHMYTNNYYSTYYVASYIIHIQIKYHFIAVFWCINSGYCSGIPWKPSDLDIFACRSLGAGDHLTAKHLSCVYFGLSTLYKGNTFDGCCELFNSVMTIITIFAVLATVCCCFHIQKATNCIAAYVGSLTAFLDVVKVIHMIFFIGAADTYEIVIIMVSVLLIYLYCLGADCLKYEVYAIIPVLLIQIITVVLETSRDACMATHHDSDGNDCPLI